MANDKVEKTMCLLKQAVGGAAAGYADVKFATTKVGPLSVGMVGAGVLGAIGIFAPSKYEKLKDVAIDLAGGAFGFEIGTLTAQKTLQALTAASAAPATTSGFSTMNTGQVGQVGRLPAPYQQPMSTQQMLNQLSALEASYG